MTLFESLLAITLFGSVFWGLAVVGLLLFMCFWADFEENGFIATGALVITGVLFYFFGRESWHFFVSLLTWQVFAIYLGVGWFYALVRVFFHGRKQAIKLNEWRKGNNYPGYEPKIDKNIKDHVFRWWLAWPFSLINWFIQDMVRDIYNWVYERIEKLFNGILEMGIKSVKEVPKITEKKTNE